MVAADAEQHAGRHDTTTATGSQFPPSFTPTHTASAIDTDTDCISPALSSAIRVGARASVCACVYASPERSSGTCARGSG